MARMQVILSILITVAIFTGFQNPVESTDHLLPKIKKTETANGQIQFKGYLLNKGAEDFSGSYQMQTRRKGTSGTSNSSQSGEIMAKANQETVLSSSSVNIQEDDLWEVILSIYQGNTLVASDTLTRIKD